MRRMSSSCDCKLLVSMNEPAHASELTRRARRVRTVVAATAARRAVRAAADQRAQYASLLCRVAVHHQFQLHNAALQQCMHQKSREASWRALSFW